MFDVKVYQNDDEKETIRDVSWLQVTAIQAALSRFGIRHFTKQVSDNPLIQIKIEEISELKAELEATRARIAELEAALQEIGASSVITRRIREIIRAALKDTP